MTVKELKESLANINDNKQVKVWIEEDYWRLIGVENVQDSLTCVTVELKAQ